MKTNKVIICFMILIISANAFENGHNKYLKTGIGLNYSKGLIGPAMITEYGYALKNNLFISPRFMTSISLDEDLATKQNIHNAYYNLGLGLQYKFSSIEKVRIGIGGNLQLYSKIYLREYENSNGEIHTSMSYVFDLLYSFYSSIDYDLIQGKNIDFGIDGTINLGEFSSISLLLYMRFKN